MEIDDTYIWKPTKIQRDNNFLLPRDIRAIVIGRSGAGKTALITYLLLEPEILDYNNLIVYGRSLHQSEYQLMQAAFNKKLSKAQIKVLFQNQNDVVNEGGIEKVIQNYDGPCKGDIDASFETNDSAILDPKDYDTNKKNLLLLDDIMLSPQNRVEQFFTRGRHNNIDVIYIAQSYFRLPRQTIRENGNLFIFFKQCKKNLCHIYQDHCASDGISYESFSNFCNDVWNQSHNFVVIDLTKPVNCGKYRKNFNLYWSPKYDSLVDYINSNISERL